MHSAIKKRPLTYGKKHSPAFNNRNLSFFANDEEPFVSSPLAASALGRQLVSSTKNHAALTNDEDNSSIDGSQAASPRRRTTARSSSSDSTARRSPRNHSPQPRALTPTPKDKDVFDIPSSDEELLQEYPVKPLKRIPAKRALVDDRPQKTSAAQIEKKLKPNEQFRKNVTFSTHDQALAASPEPSMPVAHSSGPESGAMKGLSARDRLRRLRGDHVVATTDQTSTPQPQQEVQQLTVRRRSQVPIATKANTTLANVESEQDELDTIQASSRPHTPETQSRHHDTNDAMFELETQIRERQRTPKSLRASPSEMTPRQRRVWDDLFKDASPEPPFSAVRKTPARRVYRAMPASATKMVDRLQAIASQAHAETSGIANLAVENTERPPSAEKAPAAASITNGVGSRQTYTSKRSYLVEDTFEGAMLLDIGGLPHMNGLSHLDEEDTEPNTAKIRSVHELRARGRSSRVAAETDDLLRDLLRADAPRSQRFSALIQLNAKLLDTEFAKTIARSEHYIALLESSANVQDIEWKSLLALTVVLLLQHDVPSRAQAVMQSTLTGLCVLLELNEDIPRVLQGSDVSPSKSNAIIAGSLARACKLDIWPDQRRPQLLTPRLLGLRALDTFLSKARLDNPQNFASCIILDKLCPEGHFDEDEVSHDATDKALVISILESMSTKGVVEDWPSSLMSNISQLMVTLENDKNETYSQHSRFLAYRLGLNVTNNASINLESFTETSTASSLLQAILRGFALQENDMKLEGEDQNLQLDLLILSLGVVINLSEYSPAFRASLNTVDTVAQLSKLVDIMRHGVDKASEVQLAKLEETMQHDGVETFSADDSNSSIVAYGYLAVMLASLCQDEALRSVITEGWHEDALDMLVKIVDEFIQHHQRAEKDALEGTEIWSTFTRRLLGISARLKEYM